MRWLAFLLAMAGCPSAPTTLLVQARVAAGSPNPATLAISVFDPHGARVLGRALDASKLPGSVIVSGLPDVAQTVRVVLTGTGPHELGFASVPTDPHHQVRGVVELSSAIVDSDGDGVPDEIDDCPTVSDPEQRNTAGTGPGDACGGGGDDLGVGDLGPVDLRGVDLRGADLRGVDLSAPVDFSIDAGGASKCPGSGLVVCDGFESGAIASLWFADIVRSPQDGGPPPSVTVESGRAYRGQYAAHLHVPALEVGTYIQALIRTSSMGLSSSIFMRAFFYIDPNVASQGTELMYAAENVDPFGGIKLFNDETNNHLAVEDWADPWNFGSTSNTQQTPFGRWACVEWEIDDGPVVGDAGTGKLRVWVDGVEVSDFHSDALWTRPFFASLGFGFDLTAFSNVGPFDMWLDELAIDGARIGCDR